RSISLRCSVVSSIGFIVSAYSVGRFSSPYSPPRLFVHTDFPSARVYTVTKVEKAPTGVCDVEWNPAGDGSAVLRKVVTSINPARGFACEKFQFYVKERGSQEWTLGTAAKTEWVEKNGVWVPSALTLTSPPAPVPDLIISLDWKAVNESLPEKDFQIDAMGAPAGTIIVDHRLVPDSTVIIGRVGENSPVPPPPPPPLRIWSMLRPTTIILLALALATAAIVLGLTFLKRRAGTEAQER
ncbi:MAG: hypothetical protein ACRC33_19050, partial [Gemmataceae bacterium]